MKKLISNVLLTVVIIGIALVLRAKFERFTVPQNGMYPTLPAGSTHWVTKSRYEISDVLLGDIVVYEGSHDSKIYNFVWRVIALPGDEVSIDADNIEINGVRLERKFVRSEGSLKIYSETRGGQNYEVAYDANAPVENRIGCSLTVPDDHIFVLGDNRYNALDSRYHGPVAVKKVFGKF